MCVCVLHFLFGEFIRLYYDYELPGQPDGVLSVVKSRNIFSSIKNLKLLSDVMSGIVQILNVERHCLSTFDAAESVGLVFHWIIVG